MSATAINHYEPIALTPLPKVIELDPEAGWLAWDAAVRALDQQPKGEPS